MNAKRIFRWSIIISVPIAIFWLGHYLITGAVATTNTVSFIAPSNLFGSLPIPWDVPRWIDVLIGPIWAIIVIPWVAMINKRFKKEADDLEFIDFVHAVLCILYTISVLPAVLFGLLTGLATVIVADLAIIGLAILFSLMARAVRWASK